MGQPAQQQEPPGVQSGDGSRTRLWGDVLPWLRPADRQGGRHHRRRQRHRPRRRDRVRAGGRGRAHLLPQRGRRRPGHRQVRRGRRPQGRRSSAATSPRPQHCRDIIARAVEEFGRVDVLVSNAAYQMTHGSLEEIPDDEWDYTFRTNVEAMFHLCKAAVPHMPPGSSIIGSSSVNSDSPSPTLAPYAATKAAIANFVRQPRAAARREGHPGEQCGARPDLDAADPGDHAAGEGGELRSRHAAGPARSAGRARPGLRPARLGRGQLHLRCPRRRHRRPSDPVTSADPECGGAAPRDRLRCPEFRGLAQVLQLSWVQGDLDVDSCRSRWLGDGSRNRADWTRLMVGSGAAQHVPFLI